MAFNAAHRPRQHRVQTAPASYGPSSHVPFPQALQPGAGPSASPVPPSLIPGNRPNQRPTPTFVNNATVLFGQTAAAYPGIRSELPGSRTTNKPEILVPLPPSRQPLYTPTSYDPAVPVLPTKPAVVTQTSQTEGPPSIPPKPSAYAASIASSSSDGPVSFYNNAIAPITVPNQYMERFAPSGPAPPSPTIPDAGETARRTSVEDDEFLRRAMEESAREHTNMQERLASREEEDFAKALKESMRLEDRSISTSTSTSAALAPLRPQTIDSVNAPTFLPPAPQPPPQAVSSAPATLISNATFSAHSSSRSSPSVPASSVTEYPFPRSIASQMAEDEALARRLAEEDERTPPDVPHPPAATVTPQPPAPSMPHPPPQPQPLVASYTDAPPSPDPGHAAPDPRRTYSTPDLPVPAHNDIQRQKTPLLDGTPSAHPNAPARSANQYVEPELLLGVSFGFHTPPVNSHFAPMQGPIPNIIALPYGKAPPMHIQAANWKQLLRLMAKLSATRVEPAVEAMAVVKGEMNLRVVVQFIRNHHASNDWRTVLYLTVDHPLPPKLPNASKYANGDPNVLPFSYSLSAPPALLRDGSDSSLSKYYVIPRTTTTSYPVLPITLPNLALYLTSALENSRRASNDNARRFAKLVDGCYPQDAPLDEDGNGNERRGLLGRIMKRNKPAHRDLNADVYELVTPFFSDEWG